MFTLTINDYNNKNIKKITKVCISGETITLNSWSEILNLVPETEWELYDRYDGVWKVKKFSSSMKVSLALLRNGSATTCRFNSANPITSIELVWTGRKYNINYVNLYGSEPKIVSYQYGRETRMEELLSENGKKFEGFYIDPNFHYAITVIKSEQYNDLTLYVKWSFFAGLVERSSEVKITDSGRWKQHHDEITIYFDKNQIADCPNFKSIEFHIKFEMKEDDDGLQYMMLYDQYSKKDGVGELWKHQFNRGSGKQTTYEAFEFVINVPIDDAIYTSGGKTYFILYGASGNWDDDWFNRSLSVQAYLSMNEPPKK